VGGKSVLDNMACGAVAVQCNTMRATSAGDIGFRVSLGDSSHYARFYLRNDRQFERKQKSASRRAKRRVHPAASLPGSGGRLHNGQRQGSWQTGVRWRNAAVSSWGGWLCYQL